MVRTKEQGPVFVCSGKQWLIFKSNLTVRRLPTDWPTFILRVYVLVDKYPFPSLFVPASGRGFPTLLIAIENAEPARSVESRQVQTWL